MSNLSSIEKRKIERLLKMGEGYVLDFKDRTFGEFFDEHVGIDIDQDKYRERGPSKANRLRSFWTIESGHLVATVLDALVEHGTAYNCLPADAKNAVLPDVMKIISRLREGSPVTELSALTSISDERDFEIASKQIQEAINRNQPEAALDRLHLFVIKFMRTLCEQHVPSVDRSKPLHSLAGEYIKHLREKGHLESEMTERILKSSISVLDAFNSVRNNQSLAHDNPILNYEEALLIFNHIASSVRFIKALEKRIKIKNLSIADAWDDDIPF